jgi:hypothetical protein
MTIIDRDGTVRGRMAQMAIVPLALFIHFGDTPAEGRQFPNYHVSFLMAQNQTAPSSEKTPDEEHAARLEKLRLEIASLKYQLTWYRPFLDSTPLITVIITLIGLWAGAYKYLEERRETRIGQQNSQIRADIDQILSFPSDSKISLARVTFLFHDLDRMTIDDIAMRNNISDIVEKLIANDLDFDKLRDVSFDVAAMSRWADYSQRLRAKGGSRDIRYKYFQAFRHLHTENEQYFSTIDIDESGQYIVKQFTVEAQFLRFAQLVIGYQQHVSFIKTTMEREGAKNSMAQALHNPSLVEKIFK